MGLSKAQTILKEARKCVECGADLDKDENINYVRCKACREKNRGIEKTRKYNNGRIGNMITVTDEQREWVELMHRKIEERARIAREIEAHKKQLERCSRCEWATYTGGTEWFCPLPFCKGR